ncbi:MAG: CRISPR-associated endonuclease Cas2 [Desulfitobacteriaceae bacterium]|nr:CRISPR-associated endonuclease Cas2 [Desulfitobacteriaceae bacterium]
MIRFMRMLVFFDLPVVEKEDRKIANRFRNFLLQDGFYMVQFSVYCRICNGYDSVEIHRKRIKTNLPQKGSVRTLVVTEKQYMSMDFLVGEKKPNDRKYTESQISFF